MEREEPPLANPERATQLDPAVYRIEWNELNENGAWLVMVYEGDELIDMAPAFDSEEALLAVAERLLPPTHPA